MNALRACLPMMPSPSGEHAHVDSYDSFSPDRELTAAGAFTVCAQVSARSTVRQSTRTHRRRSCARPWRRRRTAAVRRWASCIGMPATCTAYRWASRVTAIPAIWTRRSSHYSHTRTSLIGWFLGGHLFWGSGVYGYVRADKIIAFRELLAQLLPNMTGMTNEEKDPEEFLNALLKHILRPAPFLRIRYVRVLATLLLRIPCCTTFDYSDAMKCVRDEYLCQLVIDDAVELGAATSANDQLLPSVQLLLERYFIDARLEFDIQPHVLLIQLPRTAGAPRRFAHIFPNATLDVTHLVHNSECC
ncbi:unnamed protein product [Sphagnum balticum]